MFRDTRAYSGFSVDDVEKVRPFYADTLGVDARVEHGMLELHFGDHAVLIYGKGDAHEPATFTVLNFPVQSVERAVDELTAKGVTFEQYEGVLESGFDYGTDERGISPRAGGGKVAWFKDPDGNLFSIEGDR